MTHDQIKREIIRITGCTEEQYNWQIFNSGVEYATVFSGGNELGASALTHTPQFWTWYQQQFFIIDEGYCMNMTLREHDKKTMLRIWKRRHRAIEMKSYPTSDVLNQGTRELQTIHREGREI